MNLMELVKRTEKLLRNNSPVILTSLGVSGTISTAYLAGKASFTSANTLALEGIRRGITENEDPMDFKEKAKLVWKLYIPTVASGALTIGCIIFGARIGSKRATAAYSLLSVSEKAFTEYKEKVVEQLGVKKEQNIRDEIAQDRISNNAQGLVVVGAGNVLCYEMQTGRYFSSDMETLRKAVNEVNAKMIRETDASLSDFYHMVGLSNTSYSDRTGWTSCRLLELNFSTTMSSDGRPCIAFEYNYIEPF